MPEPNSAPAPGLYAIVDTAVRVRAVLAAGVCTVQLRIKQPRSDAALREAIRQSIAAADQHGAVLYVNDHWRAALELGARALHLGQEDLLGLTSDERARLREAQARGVRLGLSSHSLWELARAAAWSPSYIACGPVWRTTTKTMPWCPQGLHNLAWWVRIAPAPVVGIGGILEPAQLQAVSATGAHGGCVVRGLGDDPRANLSAWHRAWNDGKATGSQRVCEAPRWPQPSLLSPCCQAAQAGRGGCPRG
jgi:hydroxymethylpyrimidine kinase/phosphomethylpyrimidine kinase/thiamine-phosphate diphosphorylase